MSDAEIKITGPADVLQEMLSFIIDKMSMPKVPHDYAIQVATKGLKRRWETGGLHDQPHDT